MLINSKELVFVRVMNFGGTHAHLKLVLKYFESKKIILSVDSQEDFNNLKKIIGTNNIKVKIFNHLKKHVNIFDKISLHLIIELFKFICSLGYFYFFCLRNSVNRITVSVVNSERYIWLFWLPFIKVNYILHSEPHPTSNSFVTYTCKKRLGKNKKIITVSESNKQSIIEHWKIDNNFDNVIVVYNALLKDETQNKELSKFKKVGTKIILTMGHVEDYKNPAFWLKVAKEITATYDNVEFIWLGDGALLKKYQDLSKGDSRINFLGFQDPTQVLKNASIYFQPSLSETQGIAVLEAMSLKIPCIVSNVGGLKESIINDVCGFCVNVNDFEESLKAVKKLLDNPTLSEKFSENAYLRYLNLFTYNSFVSSMNKIYNS